MRRLVWTMLACALLTACGVKRPLRLPGQEKGAPSNASQTLPRSTANPVSNQDRMLDAMNPERSR